MPVTPAFGVTETVPPENENVPFPAIGVVPPRPTLTNCEMCNVSPSGSLSLLKTSIKIVAPGAVIAMSLTAIGL